MFLRFNLILNDVNLFTDLEKKLNEMNVDGDSSVGKNVRKRSDLSSSDDTSNKRPKKKRREEIQIWVQLGDGEPEEISVDPTSSISKV